MNRQRPQNRDAAEVQRLRDAGKMSEETAGRAAWTAWLWMEQDSRRQLLAGAPLEAARAICNEYLTTGFVPESLRADEEPAAGSANG